MPRTRNQKTILSEAVDVELLLQEKEMLNEMIRSRDEQIRQLQSEIEKCSTTRDEHINEISKLQTEYSKTVKSKVELIIQCNQMKKSMDELSGRVDIMKAELLEAKELLAQKNDLIENLKEELDKGTATAGNGGLDESLAVTEKNGDDPADKIMHFSIKFDGRRTIRKKKMSLMLRDLIFSTFTPDELGECTLSGRKGHKQLDPVRLECVKRKLLERFPSVPGDCLRRLVTNCLRDAKKKRNNNN